MPGIVQNHEFSASLTISERKLAHHWMDSVLASACRELESSWYFSSGTQDNTALGWWEPPHTSAELSCLVSGYAVQGTCVQRRKKITWSESQSLNDLGLLNIQKRKLKVSLHLSLNTSFQSSTLWRLWLFFSFCWAIYINFFSPCSLIASKRIDKCASLRLSVLRYLSVLLCCLPQKKKKNLLTGVGISCDFPVSQILNEILKPVRLLIHWSIWSPNFPQTVYFSLLAAQEIQLPFTGSLDFIDVLRSTLCFQMSSGSAQDLLHSLLHLSFISFSIFSSE